MVKKNILLEKEGSKIVSILSEWREKGKPVEVIEMQKEDISFYEKLTVHYLGKRSVFAGFVTLDIKERLKKGNYFYGFYGKEKLTGKVISVSTVRNINNGLYRVLFKVDKMPKVHKIYFVSILVHVDTLNAVFKIPLDAVLVDDKKSYLWKVEKGMARRILIKLGKRNSEFFEVKKGIRLGDKIVVRGETKLVEGDKVSL